MVILASLFSKQSGSIDVIAFNAERKVWKMLLNQYLFQPPGPGRYQLKPWFAFGLALL